MAKRPNQAVTVCALCGMMTGAKVAEALCQRYDPTVGFSLIQLAAAGLGRGSGRCSGAASGRC